MAAVAVWDHLPSADEMLDARVARGWEPTPTGLQSGAKVLGFAAKLEERPRSSVTPGAAPDSTAP